jgi:hypothetical protein
MLSAQDTVIYTAINDCEKAPVTPSARFAAPEQDEEEDSINSFNLYPNPNSGLFTVDIGLGDEEQAELHVWNISGQLVAQQGLSNGQSSIGLDVSNGLYLYVVTVNGERRWTGKVSVTSE